MPHAISKRVQAIRISDTKLMPMLAAELGGCLSLGQGVPSFATPGHVLDEVCRAMREQPAATKYTLQPGLTELREAVAALIAREKGAAFDARKETAITCGAMEALLMAVLTLVEPGDEVVLPAPWYPSHVEQVLMAQGVPRAAPLGPDWRLDPDAVVAAFTPRTRAVVLSSPHNPTGAVFAEDAVRAVCREAARRGIYVVCDDTYDALTYDGNIAFSPAMLQAELGDRLVLVGSFSKRFALTGFRVGFVCAEARLMDELLKVHDCTTICAPAPSQLAALASLSGPQNLYAGFRVELERRRDLCRARLDALPGFTHVPARGAFYVMARYDFTDEPSRALAERIIREARVITIPGGSFGPGGEGHLRLSFGAAPDELNACFDRLAAWLG